MQLHQIHQRRKTGEFYTTRHMVPGPEEEGLIRIPLEHLAFLTTEKISEIEDQSYEINELFGCSTSLATEGDYLDVRQLSQ
jgi:hypothetical protein